MPVRTRFAPSPTGRLHLGHVLAARTAHALAREAEGIFLLRHEDIDGPRVRVEFYRDIEGDLKWLGLQWDEEPLRQTTRNAAYEEALATLQKQGLVYPCFCTRREIQEEWARMGAAPQGDQTPVYPGTCRNLTTSERDEKLASGAAHAWRLDSRKSIERTGPIAFHDIRFGEIFVNSDLLGDAVLSRKDIGPAYHLAVVVDDAFQEITHVTRGDDLLLSTHVHRQLQVLLGLPEPIYLHHRLMSDEAGKRLSKRHNSLSVATLRAAGLGPHEVLAQTNQAFDWRD